MRLMTGTVIGILLLASGCTRHAGESAPSGPPGSAPAATAPGSAPAASAAPSSAAAPVAATGAPTQGILPGAMARPPAPEGASLLTDSSDRVHIEYHVYGQGEPAVILIHGWACNSAYWGGQLDTLKRHYTVVTLDLAGHGASGRNRADWSIARYADDVAAVAKELPNRQIVLVGHSMGGPVALAAAPRIGERVIGIIGVDTFRRVGLPPPAPDAVARQIAPFRSNFIAAIHDFVPKLFPRKADQRLVRKVADDMSHASPSVAVPSLVSLNALDYATVLPLVHVPIVAIDSDLEPLNVARIRTVVPGFRADVLRGDGHFPMLDDAQRFNPLLEHEIATLAKTQETVSR
jgi:pimeloyl-ACP methyl ester carboxylesterase